MRKSLRKILLLLLVLAAGLVGCQKKESPDGVSGGYSIYYVNGSQTNVVCQGYKPKSKEVNALIEEILDKLANPGDTIEYLSSKPKSVTLLESVLDGDTLSLSFDENYLQMDKPTEVLMRMAYVNTLVQISGVSNVEFYVREDPLLDSDGEVVGAMNENSFVQNDGSEINEYESTEIILYFASESGKKLVQTTRKVTHSANMSLEKVVVEQLLQGPSANSDAQSAIPEGTRLLRLSTKDSVCYVTLSSEFLNMKADVTKDVQIYSIVNSLAELSTVSKVQISVYGETYSSVVMNLDLDKALERKLDLVASNDEEQ